MKEHKREREKKGTKKERDKREISKNRQWE